MRIINFLCQVAVAIIMSVVMDDSFAKGIPLDGHQSAQMMRHKVHHEDPLKKAWHNKGVLFHGILDINYTVTEANKTGRIDIEADCGPQCSAWTLSTKGLPTTIYQSLGGSVGYIASVDSDFGSNYTMSMNPHDAGTVSRQWCYNGIDYSSSPGNVNKFSSLYQQQIAELSKFYNSSTHVSKTGCAEDNLPCKQMAAGGGYFSYILTDPLSSMSSASRSIMNNTISVGEQGKLLNVARGNLLLGSEPTCHYENNSLTTPDGTLNLSAFSSDCKQCGAVDICPENITVADYKSIIHHGFTLEKLMPTAKDAAPVDSPIYFQLASSCKLNTRIPSHWKILKDAFKLLWEAIIDLYKTNGSIYANNWNEVNVYAPFEAAQKVQASKALEDAIVGIYITVDPNDESSHEKNLEKARSLASVVLTNTGKPVHIYQCTGVETTDYAQLAKMKKLDFTHKRFDILGKYGCTPIEVNQ